jgi:hypothetical protein
VLVGGKSALHPEGYYSIEWYEDGTRRRIGVGRDALEAYAEKQRQAQLIRNRALGIEVVQRDSQSGTTVAASCEAFLDEVRSHRRLRDNPLEQEVCDHPRHPR